jgi:hypothetical protein
MTAAKAPAKKTAPVPAATFSDGADDFDALLDSATIEKRKSGTKDRYLPADQVPEKYTVLVRKLEETGGRLPLAVTDEKAQDKLRTLFASAAHHLGLSATTRAVYKGEGDAATVVGVSVTVTDPAKNAAKKAEREAAKKDGE